MSKGRLLRIAPKRINKLLRRALEHLKEWEHEIGVIVGQRIAAGDSEFFHQLGDALERSRAGLSVDFSRGVSSRDCIRFDGQIDNVRRFLAISHRWDCYMMTVPFTSKGPRLLPPLQSEHGFEYTV